MADTISTEGNVSMKAIIISFLIATLIRASEWLSINLPDHETLEIVKDLLYIVSMTIVIILGVHKMYKNFVIPLIRYFKKQ